MLPHRYPFLLIDRVLNVVPGESATGLKNITINEQFFAGHFPKHPIMPGVLIIEAMAQTAALMVVKTLGEEAMGKLVYFMTIEGAKFRKPVTPGDSIYIHIDKVQSRGPVWKFKGKAKVDDKVYAEAIFSAMIVDRE